MIILLLALSISWILAAPAAGSPAALHEAARTIAENILGPGQVRSVRATDDGSQLLIRWESPTYRLANGVPANRDLMYGEAVLATNAILGQLRQVARIRFTILQGGQMLATGESSRGHGLSLQFSSGLGGGIYTPPEPKVDPRPATRGTAQEI